MVDLGGAGSKVDDDLFPLSFAQQRLWLLDQLAPGRASYNIAGAFRLDIALKVEVLRGALNEIVRRHEVLRTTFHAAADGQPFQLVSSSAIFEIPLVDLSHLDFQEREAEALHLSTAIARMPFDLARGPLLRLRLLRLGATQHIFVVAMHHIVSDGWSMGVLFDELAALYSAFAAGSPSPLPELPIQYADYSVWQREWLQDETLAVQMAYWEQQLAGLPVLQLHTDFPRPLVATQRGASLHLPLSDELTSELRMLSRREGVTLFMTLLAAFQVLLHRYTRQDDIVVGSPTAGRKRPELEGLIGFFVNMIVMRTRLSGELTFLEVLKRVRDVALEAYAHQDMPFEKLVEKLQPSRDLSRNPLFQVAFQLFQEGAIVRKTSDIEAVRQLDVEKGTANFDLALSFWESGNHLCGRLEYSTDLFTEPTIARLAGHFEKLLEGIVANPACSIAELPLLTEAERNLLLGEWSGSFSISPGGAFDEGGETKIFGRRVFDETDTGALRDPGRNESVSQSLHTPAPKLRYSFVHRLFEEQVRRAPDAPAVVTEGICLSYGELNRRANQVAHFLRQSGVQPEHLVALCLDRSPSLIIAALGALKAGGAYVPLNPAEPPARLSFMLADAGACVVLTEAQWASKLPSEAVLTLVLDQDQDLLAKESEDLDVEPEPSSAAYAIYTSGSTGEPKGLLIPHRGLSNLVAWHRTAYSVTDADRSTLLAGPAFDASVWEIWPYLVAGASLHIPSAETRDTPHKLVRWFNSQGITLSYVPTPLAELLLQEPWPEQSALRALLTGGDGLHRGAGTNLPCRLFNHYGPTENTVVSTWALVDSWKEGDPPPPIGRPIANVQVYVLDSHGEPVPVGVPGELYLGGAGLARGYLNRPELTAEKFVPHPFSDEHGARLYRTGDLVRFRSDGKLEFLGRLDQQVKIRGFRIELGEIEAVLAAHPDVREAAVVMREDGGGERRLVAYIVSHRIHEDPSHGEATILMNTVADFARSRLPSYMVPSAWMLLDSLPLSPSGKINRAVLPPPDRSQPESTFQAPRTQAECKLASIWTELLGVSQVGLHDNFFQQMGGHSLLATRLISRIRNCFGVELPLRSVFETPTVAGLARAIVQQQAAIADTAELELWLREVEALPEDAARAFLAGRLAADE